MSKLAFITGITGQDGSYMSELLLQKNYKVYGIVRRNSTIYNYARIEHIRDKLNLVYGDLTDGSSIQQIIMKIVNSNENFEVLEIYNLGAQSHVAISFETPEYTAMTDAIGTLKILECIRTFPKEIMKKIKFYQAGTSEMFGAVLEKPQKETTPFNPVSPYACAKVYAHHITKNYRESYGMFACNGILFNHESPRRGGNFVTMKVVNAVKDIASGNLDCLTLGNLDSMRDWGHAKDYVRGMWLMLQQNNPDDYVLATGHTTSVRQFVEMAFKHQNISIKWDGDIGKDADYGNVLVKTDPKYFRPSEVDYLLGDPTKARERLNWQPEYDLEKLIEDMFNQQ